MIRAHEDRADSLLTRSAARWFASCARASDLLAEPRVAVGGDSPLAAVFTRVGADTGVPADLLAAVSWIETRFHVRDARRRRFARVRDRPARPARVDPHVRTPRDLAPRRHASPASPTRPRAPISRPRSAPARHSCATTRARRRLSRRRLPRLGGDRVRARRSSASSRAASTVRDDAGARDRHRRAAARRRASGFSTVAPGRSATPAPSGSPPTTATTRRANRGVATSTHIVIHDTQGSYSRHVSWFKNPLAEVSAHYVIRSSDGHIAQMVDEKNVAWHDKCFNTNTDRHRARGLRRRTRASGTPRRCTSSRRSSPRTSPTSTASRRSTARIVGSRRGARLLRPHRSRRRAGTGTHYIDLVKTGGAGSFARRRHRRRGARRRWSPASAPPSRSRSRTPAPPRGISTPRASAPPIPQDRDSAFFVDGDWLAPNRATGRRLARPRPARPARSRSRSSPRTSPSATVYDEAFQLVQEGVTWFGPTFHVVVQVMPDGGSRRTARRATSAGSRFTRAHRVHARARCARFAAAVVG